MQLTSQQRRGVIEDLLDINMFSLMNMILKEKVSKLKDEITQNGNDINLIDSKINAQKKYLRDIASVNAQFRREKEQTIQETQRDIKLLNEKNEKLSKQVEKQLEPTIENKESVQLRESKLHKLTTSIEMQYKAARKNISFSKIMTSVLHVVKR